MNAGDNSVTGLVSCRKVERVAMQTVSKPDGATADKEPKNNRRLGSPNRPVAISRFVFNTFREALLHPTTTSYIDKRTGKFISRDNGKVSENGDT